MKDKKYISLKEYSPRIYLPRSCLRPIEISLTLNLDPDYHVLDEIKMLEKQDKDRRFLYFNNINHERAKRERSE